MIVYTLYKGEKMVEWFFSKNSHKSVSKQCGVTFEQVTPFFSHPDILKSILKCPVYCS